MSEPSLDRKPRLSDRQIWNMSVGFLGIQAGFALQNANASNILMRLGADVHELPNFWLVAPVIGMIVQPIIGYFSDQTWTPLGRRKPYFLAGALMAVLGMVLMPNAGLLAGILTPVLMGAFFLMFMDASFNVSMEPFRALVADKLPSSQRTFGFAAQTTLIGIGAVIGSWLTAFLSDICGVDSSALAPLIPDHIRYSFYIGAAIFLAAIIWTITTTKEYSPKEMEAFEEPASKEKKASPGFFESFMSMPTVMFQIGLVQFFSWFALFSMWVFTTPAIAQHVYHCAIDDTTSNAYTSAGNQTGLIFGVYNIVSAIYAMLLPRISDRFGRRKTHALSLFAGALGLISIYFAPSPAFLYLSMIGVGMAWGAILSMPYAMLAGSVPARNMGIYMGIFNFFITIPQITSGIALRPIMKNIFHNHAVYALVMGGIFLFIAAAACYFIDKKADTE